MDNQRKFGGKHFEREAKVVLWLFIGVPVIGAVVSYILLLFRSH